MSLNCVIGEAIYNKDKYIYNKAADLENQGFFHAQKRGFTL